MKRITPILLAICLCSCQRSIKDKILVSVQENYKKDSCVISMKDFTPFEWDKMYIFCNYSGIEEVNDALEMDYPYFVDLVKQIIFMKSGKIVCHEEDYGDPDDIEYLKFLPPNKEDEVMVFTKSTALFKVKRYRSYDIICYDLIPVGGKVSKVRKSKYYNIIYYDSIPIIEKADLVK